MPTTVSRGRMPRTPQAARNVRAWAKSKLALPNLTDDQKRRLQRIVALSEIVAPSEAETETKE